MNPYLLLNKRFHTLDKSQGKITYLPKVSDVRKKEDPLMDYIFGVNPVTGLPTGDLAIYLSDKANPEVRQFIEMNLLKDNPSTDVPALSMPDDVVNKYRSVITDDDVAQFSRNHDETRDEYAERMRNWFADERERNFQKNRVEKFKKMMSNS